MTSKGGRSGAEPRTELPGSPWLQPALLFLAALFMLSGTTFTGYDSGVTLALLIGGGIICACIGGIFDDDSPALLIAFGIVLAVMFLSGFSVRPVFSLGVLVFQLGLLLGPLKTRLRRGAVATTLGLETLLAALMLIPPVTPPAVLGALVLASVAAFSGVRLWRTR